MSQNRLFPANILKPHQFGGGVFLCAVGLLLLATELSFSQRARIEDYFAAPQSPVLPAPTATLNVPQATFQSPVLTVPQGNFSPIPQNNPALVPNATFPTFPRAGQVFPDPRYQQPAPGYSIQPGTPVLPQGGYNYGQAPIPNRWPYEGTGSNWLPPSDWTWPQQAWSTFRNQFLPRVLERPRARQTWITGDQDNPLNINELELATTATLPNFLGSTQPLRISPGFVFHWLDGPDSTAHPGFDLPPRVYSTYLSFDHMTNPANNMGLENNLTIGFYSDFDNNSSDALRLTGKLVGWARLNAYTVGKFGVEYFDRVDTKLLPAFGFYMAPNSDIRWDLFFPRSKLAHRLPNLGDFEIWGYVGAEYGGGSWAIDRAAGTRDQADINDVRSYFGLEWMGPKRVTGFLEVGYVFERSIVYRSDPHSPLDLEDAFMLRSGLAF